ncbi:opioid-binding protein/cell adhesion molecule homolog [Saccoglossus kowalevskii]
MVSKSLNNLAPLYVFTYTKDIAGAVPVRSVNIVGHSNGNTAYVVEGSVSAFTCSVIGTKPSADIDWFIGTQLYQGTLSVENDGKLRDTTSVFTFTPNLDNDDDKQLQCKASNTDERSPVMTHVKLYVKVPVLDNPLISDTTNDYLTGSTVIVTSGESYTFTCTAGESRPESTITWYLGSTLMNANAPTTTTNGKLKTTIRSLTFTPERSNHNEQLKCRAGNDVTDPYKESYIVLDVYVSAYIFAFPSEAIVTEQSSTITLYCEATGIPDIVTYTWRKANRDIKISGRYILNDGSLTINNIVREDDGVYTCYASNGVGQPDSASATVTVYYAPVITGTTEYYCETGESISMNVSVNANPLRVTFGDWINDDVVLKDKIDTISTSTVFIDEVTELHFGLYNITARNDIGRVTLQVELYREGERKVTYLVVKVHIPSIIMT